MACTEMCGTAESEGRISSARGVWPSSGVGAQKAQAGAHPEHAVHARDAGGVKAQRLAESNRNLPSPKGASDTGKRVWHGDVAQGEGRISSDRGVRVLVWPSLLGEWGQKAQAGAHREHSAHVRDAGGVKAQRLVESSRILPSPKGASDTGKRVCYGDVAQEEGRTSSARGVRMWPSSGVGAEGACGSAPRTFCSCP